MKTPPGFERALSEFKACAHDGPSGEPTAWGFEVIVPLSEARMASLGQHGDLRYSCGRWFLITKQLSRVDAIAEYGPVSAEIHCHGANVCSVTFGQTRFVSDSLCSPEG
jgi:hypothetical protein